MNCNKCGYPNPDNALSCASCGEILPQQAPSFSSIQPPEIFQQGEPLRPNIRNYMVQSILLIVFSVICCCFVFPLVALPFAIIAVVNASKVNNFIAKGDMSEADRASKKTKKWCWIALWIIIGGITLGIILNYVFRDYWQMYFDEVQRQMEIQKELQYLE